MDVGMRAVMCPVPLAAQDLCWGVCWSHHSAHL